MQRVMNLRPGAYELSLQFVPLGTDFLKLMMETPLGKLQCISCNFIIDWKFDYPYNEQ